MHLKTAFWYGQIVLLGDFIILHLQGTCLRIPKALPSEFVVKLWNVVSAMRYIISV